MKTAAAQFFSRKTTRKHVAAKAATRKLVQAIVAAPTTEQEQRADELARKARAAKSADFLAAYRVAA